MTAARNRRARLARSWHESWRDLGVMMLQEDMRKVGAILARELAGSRVMMTKIAGGFNNRSTPFFELKTWRDFGAVTEITVPLR
jgi:hypothetical protein